MPGTHCYVPQCINNRGNGHVINDHLQAKNTSAGRRTRYIITTESTFFIFVFISDTLAVRLLGSSFTFSFASSSYLIYKFISKLRVTMHVVMNGSVPMFPGVTVCACMRFACVIRSGYLVLANQHTSSEGQGSRDLRQTRVEPY